MDLYTEPHWDRSALVTIDVQVDFTTGSMPVAGTAQVLPELRRLLQTFRQSGRPIYHAVRLYRPDGSNADLSRRGALVEGKQVVLPGSPGSQLLDALFDSPATLDAELLLTGQPQQLGPEEYVIYKPRWNAFFDTPLMDSLRRQHVDTVVIAGCNYPNCPRGTAFGASERDLRAVMASDALSGYDRAAASEMAQIGVHSVPVSDIELEMRAVSGIATF